MVTLGLGCLVFRLVTCSMDNAIEDESQCGAGRAEVQFTDRELLFVLRWVPLIRRFALPSPKGRRDLLASSKERVSIESG